MMQGYVNQQQEAVLAIAVKGDSNLKSVDAIIDTGFNGFLSLPTSIIVELDLMWSYSDIATLGDGSETLFDIYAAQIIWNGQYQKIEVNAAEAEPLLGMRMLKGYRLQIDAVEGGSVKIDAL
jgi:clan AA aspartic protease